jgi:exopolyphosphatase/guanosine-5'-triphosphate,3'-diphosphate pyrophosphatase
MHEEVGAVATRAAGAPGSPPSPLPARQVAAVDLGSNSFHMVVGRLDNGQLRIVDRLREPVRLAAGLDARKRLTPEATRRALDCLSRFGQRVRELPQGAVRAVGTNTLRQLHDDGEFLRLAEAALGHPIEVIAGREEARLVYLGVAHGLAAGDERRLVVDIGGGSTEVIIGQRFEPRERESLHMGCVSVSQRFFGDGRVSEQAMDHAVLACRVELRPVRGQFRAGRWDTAVGSSGTIKSIGEVVRGSGWADEGITWAALKRLRRALVSVGHVDKVQLPGLTDDRRPVLAGGVAVLSAVFKTLDVEHMQVSDLALREGLLYELLGHIQHEEDVRDRTVESLMRRYDVDRQQARRVQSAALALFSQVASAWQLDRDEAPHMLGWAARLHEIGLAIAHSQFHRHGAYIAANADLPGFSRQQQNLLAALIRGHRRKFPAEAFDTLPEPLRRSARQLCVLLRLAVLIHRGRTARGKPRLRIEAAGSDVRLRFPPDWLDAHPLTRSELEQEASLLRPGGFALAFD